MQNVELTHYLVDIYWCEPVREIMCACGWKARGTRTSTRHDFEVHKREESLKLARELP